MWIGDGRGGGSPNPPDSGYSLKIRSYVHINLLLIKNGAKPDLACSCQPIEESEHGDMSCSTGHETHTVLKEGRCSKGLRRGWRRRFPA